MITSASSRSPAFFDESGEEAAAMSEESNRIEESKVGTCSKEFGLFCSGEMINSKLEGSLEVGSSAEGKSFSK